MRSLPPGEQSEEARTIMTDDNMQQTQLISSASQIPEPPSEVSASHGPGSIVNVLLRRWKLFLGVWLLLAAPSVPVITLLLKPMYTAVAQIEVAPSVPAILYSDEEKPIPLFDQYLNTQASIATSQSVLTAALASPILQDLPWVKQQDAIAWLRGKVNSSTIPKTQIVQIEVRDTNPDTATRIAKAILDSYMARAVGIDAENERKRREILDKKREELRGRLDQIASEIRSLAEPFGTASDTMFESMRQLVETSNVQNKQELEHAELRVFELEHQFKQLDEENAGKIISEDLIVWREQMVNNEAGVRYLQGELDKAIAKLARWQGIYPAEDRLFLEAKKDVDTLRERLDRQREHAFADADREMQQKLKERARDRRTRIEGELTLAKQNHDILKKRVEESGSRSMNIGRQDLAIKNLREQKESVKQEYDRIREALRQLDLESRRPGRISVASAPEVKPDGIEDKRGKAIPGAIAGALILAMGLAMLRDRLDTQLRNTQQMELSMGLRLLGAIPSMKDLKSGRITREDLLESYRLIRATLAGLASGGRPPKSILITSANAAEGKTSLAVSLALTLAEAGGRVLLVDGDIQGPRIGRLLKLNPPYSLRDVLLNHRALGECVGRSVRGRFDVLVERTNGHSARGALSTQSAIQLIRSAADAYDHIVIDSPPSLGAADALVWAQAADAVIVSLLVGHSNTQAVRLACQRLAAVGARVVGSVIANVSATEGFYSYTSTSKSDNGRRRSPREPLVQLGIGIEDLSSSAPASAAPDDARSA